MSAPVIATFIFTGICYLSTASNGVQVVMPTAEEALPASDGGAIPPHHAYIMFQTAQMDTGCAEPDLRFTLKQGSLKREWGVIFLHGETLTLNNTDTPPIVFNQKFGAPPGGPNCAGCTIPNLATDDANLDVRLPYASIVHKAVACPKCGDLQPQYLNPKDGKDVAARVDLTTGFIAAASPKEDCEWTFRPVEGGGSEPAPMPLPQAAILDVKAGTTNQITIKRLGFDGHEPPAVKLKEGADHLRLLVYIGNAPLDDIERIPHTMPENVDHHFELYYKLLARDLPGHPYPHKVTCNVSIRAGNCPPIQLP